MRKVFVCSNCSEEFDNEQACLRHEKKCLDPADEQRALLKVLNRYGIDIEDTPEEDLDNIDSETIDRLLDEDNHKQFLFVWDPYDNCEGDYMFYDSKEEAQQFIKDRLLDDMEGDGFPDITGARMYERDTGTKYYFKENFEVTVRCSIQPFEDND